jgi:hypothetical protein
MLGRFRLASGRHPADPGLDALVDELLQLSAQMRAWWPLRDVAAIGSRTKKLRHPRLGRSPTHVVLQAADHPDQTW